jgi:metalloendopeptidase OMA1, mitochondrial
VTHRRRFNCMPADWDKQIGTEMQQQILKEYEGKVLPASDPRVLLVAKVLNRLIPASGMGDQEWEVHVIDEPKLINAFVIPGYAFSPEQGIHVVAKIRAVAEKFSYLPEY